MADEKVVTAVEGVSVSAAGQLSHDARKWEVVALSGSGGPFAIRMPYKLGPQTHYGVQGVKFKEDAEFIVRACNVHDVLLSTLRLIVSHSHGAPHITEDMLLIVSDVIAKAEGR